MQIISTVLAAFPGATLLTASHRVGGTQIDDMAVGRAWQVDLINRPVIAQPSLPSR